jgi:hypothetical protein
MRPGPMYRGAHRSNIVWSAPGLYSGFAIGVGRSQGPFRGFLPRKTAPRDLYQATVIAKPLRCMHHTLADRPAMEPLVFDGN